MVRATGENGKFFPTAVQIEEHAKAATKAGAGQNPNYELKVIAGATQQLHGLPPNNPYEQLARKWERENAAGSPDCSGRAKELMAVIDGNPIAHDIAGNARDWKMSAAGDVDTP